MEQPGQEQQEYASFLIRMWREANLGAPGTPAEWRGEIEHIQSGRRTDFRTLAALSDWLNAQMIGGLAGTEESRENSVCEPALAT